MSETLPIACTLSATDLRPRGEELRALGADGLLDATEEEGRAVLRFRSDPDVRERLKAIVDAESECCAFLRFEIEHGDGATVLTISAPNGGAEMFTSWRARWPDARRELAPLRRGGRPLPSRGCPGS